MVFPSGFVHPFSDIELNIILDVVQNFKIDEWRQTPKNNVVHPINA